MGILEKKVLVIRRRGLRVLFFLMEKGDDGRCIFPLTSLQIGYILLLLLLLLLLLIFLFVFMISFNGLFDHMVIEFMVDVRLSCV